MREDAIQAQRRGESKAAASAFVCAYRAAPDPCSSPTLALLFETVEVSLQAEPQAAGDILCQVEEFVDTATKDAACAANLADLADAMRDLRRARLRTGSECVSAEPVLRAPDASLPLAVEVPVPSLPSLQARGLEPYPTGTGVQRVKRARARATGGALLGLGVSTSIVALVGAFRGARLQREAEGLVTAGDECALATEISGACADLVHAGNRMNELAIGASIAATGLVITGIALLATGASAKRGARRSVVGMRGAMLTLRF